MSHRTRGRFVAYCTETVSLPLDHVAVIGPSNFAFSTPTFEFKGTVAEAISPSTEETTI